MTEQFTLPDSVRLRTDGASNARRQVYVLARLPADQRTSAWASLVAGFIARQRLPGMAGAEIAETVDALGMMSAVARRWLDLYGEGLQLQVRASNTAAIVMASSKFCRLAVQILIMAAGAWLVIDQQLTGGAMIAPISASVVMLRRWMA